MQLTSKFWMSLFSSVSVGFGVSSTLSPLLSKLICSSINGLDDMFIVLKYGFCSVQSVLFCLAIGYEKLISGLGMKKDFSFIGIIFVCLCIWYKNQIFSVLFTGINLKDSLWVSWFWQSFCKLGQFQMSHGCCYSLVLLCLEYKKLYKNKN